MGQRGRKIRAAVSVLFVGMLASCGHGVLPEQLREGGSLSSAGYAARVLYPRVGIVLRVMSPVLLSPALLTDDQDTLTVRAYLSATIGGRAAARRARLFVRSAEGKRFDLPLVCSPACDEDGICVFDVRVSSRIPSAELMDLCVSLAAHEDCSKKSFRRFSSIPDPLRLLVLADPHVGKGDAAGKLADLVKLAARATPRPDLIVLPGDLTDHGDRPELAMFLEVVAKAGVPLFAVSGNHEFKDEGIDNYLILANPYLDHALSLGPYLFVGLNTGPSLWDELGELSFSGLGLEHAQLGWLERQLERGKGRRKVVVTHHPPFSDGGGTMGRGRARLMEMCRKGDVELVLAGHTHRNEVFDGRGDKGGYDAERGDTGRGGVRPLVVVSKRSTDGEGGWRSVLLHRGGGLSYEWSERRR